MSDILPIPTIPFPDIFTTALVRRIFIIFFSHVPSSKACNRIPLHIQMPGAGIGRFNFISTGISRFLILIFPYGMLIKVVATGFSFLSLLRQKGIGAWAHLSGAFVSTSSYYFMYACWAGR